MTTVIEKAVKHFDTIQNTKLQEYFVEEWDTTVYYRPSLTWNEQAKLIDLSTQGKSSEALIETLVMRCLDKDGKHIFTSADRTTIRNSVDPDVIVKIVGRINNTTKSDAEDVEKN